MIDVTRIKKTKEIVWPMGKADSNHTLCLFKLKNPKNGKRGVIQSVRNDNLIKDKEVI